MKYLYISYNSDKNLKDCQSYKTLDEVKKERGITCNEHTLSLARVARYSSPDGSGCYLLDFQSDTVEFLDVKWASHVIKLIPSVLRELQLRKLGIN
jgi:hypothetical protein